MFKTRLLSGIVLVLIMVVTLYFGGFATLAMTAFISVVGVYELMRIPDKKPKSMTLLAEAVTLIFYLLLGLGYTFEKYQYYYLLLLTVFLMAIMCFYVFGYPKHRFEDVMLPFFAFFYVSVMLSYIYQVRFMENGGAYVVLVFLSAWGNDTCAYCVGVLFGKHKMSPKLSPKKSWEGFFGGIIGAALLGIVYAFIFGKITGEVVNTSLVVAFAAICGIGGLISVVGDLAASAIKRQYDIKDYGKLIPGHGGILDRFDSMIMTAPIVYYLVMMFV